jgi:GT2 family glycosyltransferase
VLSTPARLSPAANEDGVAATTAAAIVVHYRDAASTLRCLASLAAQTPPPAIVVVDNASPDGSGEALGAALRDRPFVTLLRAPRNGGFGAGCNLGITHVLSRWPRLEHVLLLNPDAELAPDGLARMAATLQEHPRAGVVGCRIDDTNGNLWFGAGRWRPWTLARLHGAPPPGATEHRSDLVTGACMLLAADLLRSGLRFCEDYFLYCEDVDLCLRVRDLGREIWVTQRARARHEGGGSQPGERVLGELTAERLYWLTRAKVLLARRRLPWWQRAVFLAVALVGKPIVGLLLARSVRFLGPYARGIRDGLRVGRD